MVKYALLQTITFNCFRTLKLQCLIRIKFSTFLIPISLQADGLNPKYFKLWQFNPTENIIWKKGCKDMIKRIEFEPWTADCMLNFPEYFLSKDNYADCVSNQTLCFHRDQYHNLPQILEI